jgi:hypothetical protein
MTDTSITNVKSTKDYKMFKLLSYNREVDEARVKRIAEVIREDGFLVPILITEECFVIDGQHRLRAAEDVGCMVTYITYHVEKDKIPLVVSKLNATSRPWGTEQYYDMWVSLKKPIYSELENIRAKNEISFSTMFSLLTSAMQEKGEGYDIVRGQEKFKSGKYSMTESQFKRLDERCKWWNEIIGYSPKFDLFGKAFRSAVTDVIRQKKYNHEIMMRALIRGSGSLLGCHARAEYFIQLIEEYNRIAKGEEKIRLSGKNKR